MPSSLLKTSGSFKISFQDLLVPFFVILSLLILFFTLPGPVMDILLALNIALSVSILLTTLFIRTPLEFSIFPTVLLATTLFRLVLNVATTRLILTRGSEFGEYAAGKVIRSFSQFVTGENIVVGIVIFAIFIVIQFVVITKGATRISEVAARFTLDAMPGRQMAIDADLNAGLINQEEAQKRRTELTSLSDFFGSMDGASKFVRGDAIASVIITLVNVAGGLLIGVVQNGQPLENAVAVYTKLTIGDGLVSQVPALLISLATGLLVTRSSQAQNLPQLVIKQIFFRPVVLTITATFLLLLTFTGMPILPLLVLGCGCLSLAWFVQQTMEKDRLEKEQESQNQNVTPESEQENPEEKIENYLIVDQMELEIGVGLIPLADPQHGGDLLERFRHIRRKIASEIGIIVPKIRIRDSLNLDENQYQIKIFGEPVAAGMIYPKMLLAIDSGMTSGKIQGIQTTDPAFGTVAFWIAAKERENAQNFNYTVVEPGEVLETHLTETIRKNADELLTRDATRHLIMELRETTPVVVDELIPNVLKLSQIQQILQMLLRERVPIRQLGAILETLSVYAERTNDPILLTEYVRCRLGRTLCLQFRDMDDVLHVVMLTPEVEDEIKEGNVLNSQGIQLNLSPQIIDKLCQRIGEEIRNLTKLGFSPVLLVSPSIRPVVRELTQTALPALIVMSFSEVTKDTKVVSEGLVAEP